ncbi:MAG TPA: GAF and ANTAR domain-containing protein [Geodermatophilus sp.]|nr:GAF and ANTAR domain-containing protein [Geodermatophilus sp.]
MKSLLQSVADLAKKVMPGSPEVSVSLLINDRASTAVFTGQLALDGDESQYGRGYGPCLHAASTGELVEIADAQAETRWPDYMEHAVEHGALSSLSVPLPINEGIAGAVNIYARKPNAFDEDSRSVATRFAAYAAVAAANMYAYEEARDLAENLPLTVTSRAVIDQAKGMLMERYRITADQAFQALAQVAMHTDTKVRDIAVNLVRTGKFPRGVGPTPDQFGGTWH